MTGRIWCLLALVVIFHGEARAQTALQRIEPRLAKAIEQHRVFPTCSSRDPQLYASLLRSWKIMVADARQWLADRYTSLADLAAFDARTSPDAVKLSPDTPPAKVETFCTVENAGWFDRYSKFEFIFKIDDRPLSASSF